MARPRKVGKKTTIGISENLVGWLEFAGREYSGGMTEYLMKLAERDRMERVVAGDKDGLAERYRAYLTATGRDDELAALGTMEDAHKYRLSQAQEVIDAYVSAKNHDCDS